MDTAVSDIRAVEFTPSRDGDSPVLPDLLDQVPEDQQVGTVTADGASGTRRSHTAIIDRQAAAISPIRRNGRPWKDDCPAAAKARNETFAPHGTMAGSHRQDRTTPEAAPEIDSAPRLGAA